MFHQPSQRPGDSLRSPYFNRARRLPRANEAQVKHVAHGGHDFGGFLRRGVRRQGERTERHTVKLLVIFRVVGGDQKLVRIER